MANKRAHLQTGVAGAPPEQVLVLEIAGSVGDFVKAVQRIEGADWLGEVDEDLEPDGDFYRDEDHRNESIGGQLFLIMSDQRALDSILALWQRWLVDPTQRFERGLAPWKHVFAQLKDIRPWDARDRVADTGIAEDWSERTVQGQQVVPVEIELWFRSTAEARQMASTRVRSLVDASGGRVISEAEIGEISYHAVLAEVPTSLIPAIVDTRHAQLVRADDVMFFRPTGQAISLIPDDEPLADSEASASSPPLLDDPVVALLDGLPLENHETLSGLLTVDDPDGWSADYIATDRVHGTAMASFICRGDLAGNEQQARRKLYVRPIMRPGERAFDGTRAESVPDSELFVDLLHRAVRRLFESEGEGQPAVAPTVRVINLSVCDRLLSLGTYPSPIARMIDWLSWRYGVVFALSAGNHAGSLTFPRGAAELDALSPPELEALTLEALVNDAPSRRLLAPGEAINALTLGAAHADAYTGALPGVIQRNLIESPHLPSPINALGLGFRRTVKPDVLIAGGRQMYSDTGVSAGSTTCSPIRTGGPPGQQAASPGSGAGQLTATRFSRGTSNAAARASRQLAWLYDSVVAPMRDQLGDLPDAVLLKALLVHAASWDGAADRILPVLDGSDWHRVKDHLARLVGYGAVDETRLGGGTSSRVVLVGAASLAEDLAHVFTVPLPPSLAGTRSWRRLTLTLAWASPINPRHRSYRRAQLWFDVNKDILEVERANAHWQSARRGTLQHEVLEGERAAAFADGDTLEVRVNCKADAGELAEEVPYGLVVTLESAESIGVSIYDEVQARIQPQVTITPQA